MNHLTVALDTAAAGWPVFPCLPTKRPATTHGLHDATLDIDRIRQWWEPHPTHLIGTPTEGLVVVDLDQHPDHDTHAWWAAQVAEHGAPPTPEVATPSGGRHVYFSTPDGHPGVRNSASKLAPGVDVRGDGGYVIAPGSTLPNGRAYVLEVVAELHDAPAWLLNAIADSGRPTAVADRPRPTGNAQDHSDRYARTALESELGRLATARQGTRNHQLNESAYSLGQLVGAGRLDPGGVTYELMTVAIRIGLTETEATGTIASGLRAGVATPRRAS